MPLEPLSRRTFLRASGVAIGLPLLDAMLPRARAEAKKMLDRVTSLVDELRQRTDKLANALDEHAPNAEKHAKFMRDTIVPAMTALRDTGDQIELVVPHELWPLPTYREMLFIK